MNGGNFFLQKNKKNKNIINIEVHAFNDLEHRAEHVLIAVCCIRCVCRWYMLNILCSTFGVYYYVNHIKKTFIFIRSISLSLNNGNRTLADRTMVSKILSSRTLDNRTLGSRTLGRTTM